MLLISKNCRRLTETEQKKSKIGVKLKKENAILTKSAIFDFFGGMIILYITDIKELGVSKMLNWSVNVTY
jgi:hypothetical protein